MDVLLVPSSVCAPFTDKVLAFILAGLRNREISTRAAWAIQAICEHCRESMVQNLDGLLQVGGAS